MKNLPDFVIETDDTRQAIEVELTRKTPARIKKKLLNYKSLVQAGEYTHIVYLYQSLAVRRLVAKCAEEVGLEVTFGNLDEMLGGRAMFDYPDNNDKNSGQSSTDREIGIFAGILIGGIIFLVILGLFLPALLVSFLVGGLAVGLKKMKWLSLTSGLSLILFIVVLMKFKIVALFQFLGLYKSMIHAKAMQVAENVFNHGKAFEITWESFLLEFLLGITLAFLVALVINKLQANYFVKTKEDSTGKFLKSNQFKKIFKQREKIAARATLPQTGDKYY